MFGFFFGAGLAVAAAAAVAFEDRVADDLGGGLAGAVAMGDCSCPLENTSGATCVGAIFWLGVMAGEDGAKPSLCANGNSFPAVFAGCGGGQPHGSFSLSFTSRKLPCWNITR